MAEERHEALREARTLLATCWDQVGTGGDPTLTLLVRAVERLADAVAGAAGDGAPRNDAVVDETTGAGGAAFDRARPPRGYCRGE